MSYVSWACELCKIKSFPDTLNLPKAIIHIQNQETCYFHIKFIHFFWFPGFRFCIWISLPKIPSIPSSEPLQIQLFSHKLNLQCNNTFFFVWQKVDFLCVSLKWTTYPPRHSMYNYIYLHLAHNMPIENGGWTARRVVELTPQGGHFFFWWFQLVVVYIGNVKGLYFC